MSHFYKRRFSLLAAISVLLALICAALPSSALPALSYDLVRDYSIAANPNGVWAYGWTSPVVALGRFNLFTATDSFSVPGMSAWLTPAPYPKKTLLVSHNDTELTICAQGYCVPPGYLQLVPGTGGLYSVVRWTAPFAGVAIVRGTFRGLDHIGPTQTNVHVSLNSYTSLMSGRIAGDNQPLGFQLVVKVAAGDTIDFAVGASGSGNPALDSTGLKGTITLQPCNACS